MLQLLALWLARRLAKTASIKTGETFINLMCLTCTSIKWRGKIASCQYIYISNCIRDMKRNNPGHSLFCTKLNDMAFHKSF